MAKTKKTNKEQETKAIEVQVQEVAVVEETPVVETAAVEEKPANETKKDSFISIAEVTAMYAELGIKCKNPQATGAYRIMGSGSSLNVKPKKGYYIYSSDSDLELIKAAGLENKDLIVEVGTNAQDKKRPNTIICTALETLRALLAIYATNPENAIQAVTEK